MGNSEGRSGRLSGSPNRVLLLLAKVVLFPILRGFFRLRVTGKENIPRRGAFILASNHVSFLDPPLLGFASPRLQYYFSQADQMRIPVVGQFIRAVGAVPLAGTGGQATSDIRRSVEVLKRGYPLVLFPEGTRSKTGRLMEAKPGIGFIVRRLGVLVVPVYIDGSYRAMPPGGGFLIRHERITVRIGKPCRFTESSDTEIAARIMDKIRELEQPQ